MPVRVFESRVIPSQKLRSDINTVARSRDVQARSPFARIARDYGKAVTMLMNITGARMVLTELQLLFDIMLPGCRSLLLVNQNWYAVHLNPLINLGKDISKSG